MVLSIDSYIMSTRKASNKRQQLELSPDIGKTVGQVTKMRKGVPDEYTNMLRTAVDDTYVMVEQQIIRSCEIYVKKLYNILIKHDYPPKQARVTIKEDCNKLRVKLHERGVKFWSEEYVLKFLPEETRDESKVKGGKARAAKQKEKLEQESKEKEKYIEKISPRVKAGEKKLLEKLPTETLRGLAAADPETRQRVAEAGGNAKYEQRPEDYSEMGKIGMENRWGKIQLVIEQEEHQLFVNAYKESVQSRDDGTGAYTVDIKNGDIEKVEPIIGNTQQSINK